MTKRGFRKELTGSKHPVAVAYTGDPDSEGNAKLRKDRYYVLFLDPTGEYMGDAEEYQKVEEAVQERRKETAEEVGDVVRE
jgi:hypothetical protein